VNIGGERRGHDIAGLAFACGALIFVALVGIFIVAFPPEDLR